MPYYRANCLDQDGKPFELTLEASTVTALRQAIEARPAFLLSHTEIHTKRAGSRTRLSLKTRAHIFNLLSLQLENGVNTDVAIAQLKDVYPDKRARSVLRGIHAELAASKCPLSDAMALFPRSFPPEVVSSVRVGEGPGAGLLAARFRRLRESLLLRLEIRATTVRMFSYPAFVMVCACAVVAFLLLKLVPLVSELLATLHVPMPGITLAVIGTSQFARAHFVEILAAFACAVVGFALLRRSDAIAGAFDRLLFKVPLVGSISRALHTGEVARTFSDLYGAGQPATVTLAACAAVVRNRSLRAALLRAARGVETGELSQRFPNMPPVTQALRSTGHFPELALTIIGTGETSGNLEKALDNVADHYTAEAKDLIRAFLGIFDKVIMILLIATIGTIVVGIYLPIITATANFQ